jgi:hypothetical protein
MTDPSLAEEQRDAVITLVQIETYRAAPGTSGDAAPLVTSE